MSEKTQDTVSPAQARELIASGEARAVDIRDDAEWDEETVPGAIRLGHGERELDAEDPASGLPDDLPDDVKLVLICGDGKRSSELAEKLRESGRDAVSVKGGIKSWQSERMPTQPADDFEFQGPGDKPPGM